MKDLRIARITPRDAKGLSDHLLNLRHVVSQREGLYPGIDRWFDKRVISGLAAQERIAYVGYVNEDPAVAAIVKLGEDAKVCHINIRNDLQQAGLGEMFFSLLALEARSHAKTLHLTLPESLWASKMGFFRDFGLDQATIAGKQYRLFDEELALRRDFSTIWQSVLGKIPKLAHRFSLAGNVLSSGVLFSVQPQFAEKIIRGTKTIEIRRRFSRAWLGQRAVFYASAPLQALMGQADIKAIHSGSPEEIWSRFQPLIGCDEAYYRKYVAGCSEVFGIELANVNPFVQPIFLHAIAQYTRNDVRPPQSYLSLMNDKGWSEAVNISLMLQCLFQRIGITAKPKDAVATQNLVRARRVRKPRSLQNILTLREGDLFED